MIDSAQKHDLTAKPPRSPTGPVQTLDATPADTIKQEATDRLLRRTKVPPDIWQDTLSLLCDTQYAVRADYAAGLVTYVTHEYPKRGDSTDADGVRRARPLSDGPIQHAATVSAILHGKDFGVKFLSAIHAYLFVLATSADLGICTSSASPSPVPPPPQESQLSISGPQVNVHPATPSDEPNAQEVDLSADNNEHQLETNDQHLHHVGRRSFAHLPRVRKTSGVKRLFENSTQQLAPNAAATWADYAHILDVLTSLHQQLPIRALLTGIPMLLGLDAACRDIEEATQETLQRVLTIRYVIAKVWLVIGNIWDCAALVEIIVTVSLLLTGTSLPLIRRL